MPKVSATIHIDCAPAKIWALLDDFKRMPEYVHFVREVFDYSAPPLKVGSKYSERSKPGPVEAVSHWTVTEADSPRRQVHQTNMPDLVATLTITLDEEAGGTRYAQSTDFTFLPKARPVGWLMENLFMRRLMQGHMERIVANVKRIAEAER